MIFTTIYDIIGIYAILFNTDRCSGAVKHQAHKGEGGIDMKDNTVGGKTLLLSILMASPGPLVLGLNLIFGRSATQIADFIRRSAEFLAIVTSYVIFKRITKCGDSSRKRELESKASAFVGCMMCVAGAVMTALALAVDHQNKGNVVPSLVIAGVSAISNAIFWYRYVHLGRMQGIAIFAAQARLYRAKTLIDTCVVLALSAVIIAPNTVLSAVLDLVGSFFMAIYLTLGGIKTLKERKA